MRKLVNTFTFLSVFCRILCVSFLLCYLLLESHVIVIQLPSWLVVTTGNVQVVLAMEHYMWLQQTHMYNLVIVLLNNISIVSVVVKIIIIIIVLFSFYLQYYSRHANKTWEKIYRSAAIQLSIYIFAYFFEKTIALYNNAKIIFGWYFFATEKYQTLQEKKKYCLDIMIDILQEKNIPPQELAEVLNYLTNQLPDDLLYLNYFSIHGYAESLLVSYYKNKQNLNFFTVAENVETLPNNYIAESILHIINNPAIYILIVFFFIVYTISDLYVYFYSLDKKNTIKNKNIDTDIYQKLSKRMYFLEKENKQLKKIIKKMKKKQYKKKHEM